jgi:hypothetical protein
MRPGLKSLVLALGVLVLAACVALPKAPTLSWTGVNLDIIGVREQRFTLKLKVANPNDVDLAPGVRHRTGGPALRPCPQRPADDRTGPGRGHPGGPGQRQRD